MSEVVSFPGGRRRPPSYDRLLEAVLVATGELGYEQVAVKDVMERAEVSRATFYKHFTGKEECFVQAHGDACEWMYQRLIGAAKRQATWREGLRAALTELLEFCANQPAIAKAVLVDVHTAGGRAMAQRDELMERLSRALDSARREIPSRQAPPPPMTSSFMIGAIDTMVAARLMDGDGARAPELLPGLLYFVVKQYFGEEAAWEEMAAAPVAQWRARRSAASGAPANG